MNKSSEKDRIIAEIGCILILTVAGMCVTIPLTIIILKKISIIAFAVVGSITLILASIFVIWVFAITKDFSKEQNDDVNIMFKEHGSIAGFRLMLDVSNRIKKDKQGKRLGE